MKIIALTESRLPQAAALHAQAFAGSLSTRLGQRYIQALLRLHLEHPDGIALVAVENNQVMGYVVGGHVRIPVNEELAGVVVRCVLFKPWLVFNSRFREVVYRRIGDKCRRYKRARTPVAEIANPTIRLLGIGVAPSAQGRGIGKRLMADFECIAAERYRDCQLVLSVDKDNVPANSLYRSLGWRATRDDGHSLYYSKLLARGDIP